MVQRAVKSENVANASKHDFKTLRRANKSRRRYS